MEDWPHRISLIHDTNMHRLRDIGLSVYTPVVHIQTFCHTHTSNTPIHCTTVIRANTTRTHQNYSNMNYD